MRTLVPDPPPAEFEALLERRRRSGADRRDEVWEGVLHLAPAAVRRHADLQAQVIAILYGPARALMVDPEKRTVELDGSGGYARVERSGLIDFGSDRLAAQIDWP